MNYPHNLYIHVPFCMSKCQYCAFFSHACARPDWDTYANEIISEIDDFVERMGRISVPTIFFGGGTPSMMPTHIFEHIMSHINNRMNISPNAEITIEANPGTIDTTRLDEFISAGINRLSIGVQSLDDGRLRFLGRRHDVATARRLIDAALTRNIRTSCDFIYGLPGDNTDTVITMCQDINKLGLKHCSMYELTIEPDTPFGKMQLDMPSNTEMADMYNAIDATLAPPRYEVSNYAIPGNECQHNMNVWDGQPYIGIGDGAAGRVLINNTWYEQRGNHAQFTTMTQHERTTETIITGMRQLRGVKITDDVKKIIDMDFINLHHDLAYITPDNRLAPTKKGMLILDDLLLKLIR